MKKMIKMKRILLVSALFISFFAGATDLINVYPKNWWVGMKNSDLQLMVHSVGIGKMSVAKVDNSALQIVKLSKADNPNYLFIDVKVLNSAKPGMYHFTLTNGKDNASFVYELKARKKGNGVTWAQGLSAADLVYLIMPDRFANGNQSNDIVKSYRDATSDDNDKFARHGGDFEGIEQRLDYIKNLGVTSIWLTPVIENDMPKMGEWGHSVAGYHGYWFTDHYEIDKRFGGNEGYSKFCETLHQNGLKVIQDAVYNHVGNHHWLFLDPPSSDWFNSSQGTKGPNHREEVFFDPYASQFEKRQMLDGWFVPHLPDLNQRNPFVSKFLIQHAVWTTEEYGIDAWRVDTYKYCEEQFLNDVNKALYADFPKITILGESYVNSIFANAYFTNNNVSTPFKHNANGVLDFQTSFSIMAALNEPYGWTTGASKLYMTLSQDRLYANPMNNCIFLDNHDLDRIYSIVGENWNKLKTGINWLYTIRGIPQLYYGTEILMKNTKAKTDADVREDFPGGFSGPASAPDAVTRRGLTNEQKAALDYISALGKFRKTSSAITKGKLMQFIPTNGVYTYFRYDDKQTIMVISNTSAISSNPPLKVYEERLNGFTKARNVVTGAVTNLAELILPPGESYVFELLK